MGDAPNDARATAAPDRVAADPAPNGAALFDVISRVARIGGWSLDAATRRVHWTDEVFRLHDMAPGPTPDLARAIAFYDPPARPMLLRALEQCLRDGQPFDLEFPMVTAAGRRIWVCIKGEAEREGGRADGMIERLVGSVQDVTERIHAQAELRESEDRYRGIFDNAADPILIISLDGYIRDANPMACRTYGYRLDEFVGLHGSRFVHADHAYKFADALAAIQSGRAFTVESVDLRKGGVPFPIDVHITPFIYKGEPVMLCLVRDISERHRTEARMREALAVFNASTQAIMTTDAAGTITAVNPAFTLVTGFDAAEAVGRSPSILGSGRHDPAFFSAMWASLLATGSWEGEVWNRRRNGEIFVVWQTVSSVRDNQGTVVEYVAMFSDITLRKQQADEVWRQANFDALTGLANRRLFQDRLERAMAEARRDGTKVGVLFLDLDAFKSVNDTLGHDAGDQLLVEVARRLQRCVRERDTVARLGGDEFTLVIHGVTDADDLRAIAEKATAALREPVPLSGAQHRASGSVGITVFPDDGADVQALLRNADIAMYQAKQAGRDRVQFFSPQMQADALRRLHLEAELRDAVANHQFALYFQPIVDADSGELVGAEALLRWLHPNRGVLSPGEFIAAAEDSGAIHPIGRWVWREAVRHWRGWQRPGLPPLQLAINVSTMQLRDDALPDLVAGALGESDHGRGGLMLEVTESMVSGAGAAAESRLPRLRALGVGCTLDRFGTGLSSLASLKRLQVDIVKIDRSFVQDCPRDRDNAHLVEAIVGMAHSLGLRVAACGVENTAQLAFLRDLGCDQLQGHLVGAPMPAGDFERLLRHRQLLHPNDRASPEQSRLLAALRQDEIDVDDWLRRLLGEFSSERAAVLEHRGWTSRGVDLRQAVNAHLQCRRCLTDHVCERPSRLPSPARCPGPGQPCTLDAWLASARQRGDERFGQLRVALDAYQQLASQIANDFRLGYRDSARRTLASLKFRTASRDVVLALIDGFKDAGDTAPGALDD